MSLNDRLSEALANTPADNTRRSDALKAALNAGDTEAETVAALKRLIEAREQAAAQFDASEQKEMAEQERHEAAYLQSLLGEPGTAPAAKTAPRGKGKGGALLTRNQTILALVALAAAGFAAYEVFGAEEPAAPPPGSDTIAVYKDDYTMGNPKAPIKLLEYAAHVCPYCGEFATKEFPELKRDFIDTGKVFYIFRLFPLREEDGLVEGIARCLPKDRYFPYTHMMFASQSQWDPDGYVIPDPKAAIIKLAAKEGITPEKAEKCMTDPVTQDRINQSAQDAVLRYSIRGTPTFIMNGQVVNLPSGYRPVDVLKMRINSLLGGKTP